MTNKTNLIYSEFGLMLKIIWKQVNENQTFELFNALKKPEESDVSKDVLVQKSLFIVSKLVDLIIAKLES